MNDTPWSISDRCRRECRRLIANSVPLFGKTTTQVNLCWRIHALIIKTALINIPIIKYIRSKISIGTRESQSIYNPHSHFPP